MKNTQDMTIAEVLAEFDSLTKIDQLVGLEPEDRVRYDELGLIVLDHYNAVQADLVPAAIVQDLNPDENGFRHLTLVEALLLMKLGGLFSGLGIRCLTQWAYFHPKTLGYEKIEPFLDGQNSMLTFSFVCR